MATTAKVPAKRKAAVNVQSPAKSQTTSIKIRAKRNLYFGNLPGLVPVHSVTILETVAGPARLETFDLSRVWTVPLLNEHIDYTEEAGADEDLMKALKAEAVSNAQANRTKNRAIREAIKALADNGDIEILPYDTPSDNVAHFMAGKNL